MNLIDAGGIKKAQDPIMIGKATCGDNPREKTMAMHGAWRHAGTVLYPHHRAPEAILVPRMRGCERALHGATNQGR